MSNFVKRFVFLVEAQKINQTPFLFSVVFASFLFSQVVAAADGAAPASSAEGKKAKIEISAENNNEPIPVIEVNYAGGKLSLKAEKADLAVVLRKVSEVAGIEIEVGTGVSGNVSLSFVALPLEDGVNRIPELLT